ncbi:MAG: AAA family ATPase [Desulfamplus sp.]|nr:AAA family ATPase [Desulfamplus sp.]
MIHDHFINQIEMYNFRCFDYLKVENLKRVNLLGGDNNIGKSGFLEALEAVTKTKNPSSLLIALRDIINRRQAYNAQFSEFDVIRYGEENLKFETNTISINFQIKSDEKLSNFGEQLSIFDGSDQNKENGEIDENLFVEIKVNNEYEKISYSKFMNIISRKGVTSFLLRNTRLNENVDFINSTIIDERKLASIYGYIVDMGMMDIINTFLKEFDPRIESLIIRPTETYSVFKIKLKDRKEPVLLSSMGGGLNRYIAIVCAIWKSKDGQLLIDEVENGIHYTKYEKLWEIIFEESIKANCQIFITTHSKECIEAFTRAAERYDNENIKYLNFSRTVDNSDKIVVTVLDSVGLENNFELGLDIR